MAIGLVFLFACGPRSARQPSSCRPRSLVTFSGRSADCRLGRHVAAAGNLPLRLVADTPASPLLYDEALDHARQPAGRPERTVVLTSRRRSAALLQSATERLDAGRWIETLSAELSQRARLWSRWSAEMINNVARCMGSSKDSSLENRSAMSSRKVAIFSCAVFRPSSSIWDCALSRLQRGPPLPDRRTPDRPRSCGQPGCADKATTLSSTASAEKRCWAPIYSEDVTGKVEGVDQPTSVAQQLVGAYTPRPDFVEALGVVAFSKTIPSSRKTTGNAPPRGSRRIDAPSKRSQDPDGDGRRRATLFTW